MQLWWKSEEDKGRGGVFRHYIKLFHPTIADLIEEDHICRLLDDVVESINFESIAGKYDGPGSPADHPKVMMKLLIQSGMHST